jgi:hypothetical protein
VAPPTFIANGSFAGSSGAINPGNPSSGETDDIIILAVETDDPEGVSFTQNDAGFEHVAGSPVIYPNECRLSVFWSRATQNVTPNCSIADAGNHILARTTRWRGVPSDGTVPWDIVSIATWDSGSIITLAGGTTRLADNAIFGIAASSLDTNLNIIQSSDWNNTTLGSVTHNYQGWINTGNGGGFGTYRATLVAAGSFSETTAAFTSGGNSHMATMQIALRSLALPDEEGSAPVDYFRRHDHRYAFL